MNLVKSLLAVLTAAILLVVPTAANPQKPTVANSVYPLQMMIHLDTGELALANICTTTSVSSTQHLWLTAAHCVANEDMTAVSDKVFAIDRHKAVPVKVDLKNDLALIYTQDFYVPALRVAKTPPTYGDTVTVWGHPLGWNDVVFGRGYISSPLSHIEGSNYLLFAVPVAPGNSGSSILNSRNEIVSICQVVWSFFPAFEPISGGAPFSVLKEFVAGVN